MNISFNFNKNLNQVVKLDLNYSEFVDIPGYKGHYLINSKGIVISTKRNKHKLMTIFKDDFGYKCFVIYKNGKSLNVRVHVILATIFIPNPNHYRCVNHKDENPSNNELNNLEWCTHAYNINYSNTRYYSNIVCEKPIQMIDVNGVKTHYKSATDCAKINNLLRQGIYNVLNKPNKSYKSYKFRNIYINN